MQTTKSNDSSSSNATTTNDDDDHQHNCRSSSLSMVEETFKRRNAIDALVGYRVGRIGEQNEPRLELEQFLEVYTRNDSMHNRLATILARRKNTGEPLDETVQSMVNIYDEARDILKNYDNAIMNTVLRFVGRNSFIVSPPLVECNHAYVSAVRNIWHSVQIELGHQNQRNHAATTSGCGSNTFKPRTASKRTINPISTTIAAKKLKEAELVNGTLKKQTQGGNSIMRQKILPQLCSHVLRAIVLPDETLPLNTLSLPAKYRPFVDAAPCSAIVKRDPVLRAILTFAAFKFHAQDCFKLNSALFRPLNLDLDGDTITVFFVFSIPTIIEQTMRTHVEHNMYQHFRHTIVQFNQPHVMFAHRYWPKLLDALPPWMRNILRVARQYFAADTQSALQESLTTIAELAGPYGDRARAPYEFASTVVRLVYEFGAADILPMITFDDRPDDAFNIVYESGAKGDPLLAERLRNDVPTNNQQMAVASWKKHNELIQTNTTVWTEWYNSFLLLCSTQKVKVDYSGIVVYTIETDGYNFGHITQFLNGQICITNFALYLIDNDICLF